MSNTYITNATIPNYSIGVGSTGYNGTWQNTTTTSSFDSVLTVNNNSSLSVKGKMLLNDRDLEERLDTIEKVLQIPERDVKLESKYPKLKKMYDEYINELSKARMWESLKGNNND
jgi:hypothetical protein